MPATGNVFAKAPLNALKGLLEDLSAGATVVKCALFSTAPSQEADTFADLTGECSGDGYTAGGATLTGKTVTEGTLVTTFDAADVSWSNLYVVDSRYAVIYNATTGKLIASFDFGQVVGVAHGTLALSFHASGIMTFTVA